MISISITSISVLLIIEFTVTSCTARFRILVEWPNSAYETPFECKELGGVLRNFESKQINITI